MRSKPLTPMIKPNLFLVGAYKSGTTSMYRCLGEHPEIFVPQNKEPGFFGEDLSSSHYIRDRESYLRLFSAATTEAYRADGSPSYLLSTRAAEEIRRFDPEARILIMLRNPVEVMYSMHGQQLHNGHETIGDFSEALAAEAERVCGRRLPRGGFLKKTLLYREVVRFTDQVARFLDVFERSKVQIVLLDDFVRDAEGTVRETLAFLGVAADFTPEVRVENAARTVRFNAVQRFLHLPPPTLSRVAKALLPARLRPRIWRFSKRLNTRPGRRPMDAGLRRSLQHQLRDEVRRLGELIGRDLSAWRDPDQTTQPAE